MRPTGFVDDGQFAFAHDPGKDLRHYDEQAQAYAVVPGEYELQVGASSADIRARTRLAVEQD